MTENSIEAHIERLAALAGKAHSIWDEVEAAFATDPTDPTVLGWAMKHRPDLMGSYHFAVGRFMAAAVEIVRPMALPPLIHQAILAVTGYPGSNNLFSATSEFGAATNGGTLDKHMAIVADRIRGQDPALFLMVYPMATLRSLIRRNSIHGTFLDGEYTIRRKGKAVAPVREFFILYEPIMMAAAQQTWVS